MPRIVCATTDDTGSCPVAVIGLGVRRARWLLACRPLFARVRRHGDRLYCLEFFDPSPAFGDGLTAPLDLEAGAAAWHALPAGVSLTGEAPTAVSAVKVCEGGVLWSASPKHSDGYFETPELPWAQLEAVARGECPFTEVPPRVGEGEGDG